MESIKKPVRAEPACVAGGVFPRGRKNGVGRAGDGVHFVFSDTARIKVLYFDFNSLPSANR